MNEYFGKQIILTEEVQYIGNGEDPKDNIGFQIWLNALKKVHGQPERLSEKTVNNDGSDSLTS